MFSPGILTGIPKSASLCKLRHKSVNTFKVDEKIYLFGINSVIYFMEERVKSGPSFSFLLYFNRK